jgi:hypothetical protein
MMRFLKPIDDAELNCPSRVMPVVPDIAMVM